MILKARAILLNDITADIEPNRSATESKNYTSLWTEELSRRVWHIELRAFFSVQRLHGFRQVVQHVQLHVANWGSLVN
jgi:hypothetical protein